MFIEYSLVFPLAILLTLGFTDLGRMFWTLQDAYRVTSQTARCGAIDTSGACPNLVDYANAIDYPMSSVTYTASTTSCGTQPSGTAQSGVLVTATINFEFLVYGPSSLKQWTVSTCYSKST